MIEVELIGQIGFKKLREKDSGKKYLQLSIADYKYVDQHKSVTWYSGCPLQTASNLLKNKDANFYYIISGNLATTPKTSNFPGASGDFKGG